MDEVNVQTATSEEKATLNQKIQSGWTSLSKGKQMAVGIGLVAAIAGIGYYGVSGSGKNYVTLYSGLDYQTAGEIKNSLEESGVTNYKIGDNGTSILVLESDVDRLRMDLAVNGVSPTNGTGYELFDSSSLGMTEQERNITYQRALEGELRRSIMSLDAVSDARVHLNLIEDSVFMRNEGVSTASVVLTLKGSKSLDEAQVKGIMALVSGAVKNLSPENIDIIDTNGNLLSAGYSESSHGASGDRISQEVEYEKHLEDKLKAQLGKVFGHDKMAISVRVSLNQTSEEQRKEEYEDGALVSNQAQFDRLNGVAGENSSGSPIDNNMQNTIDVGEALEDEGMISFNQTNNYQNNMTETHTVKPPGEINTLTVSVIYSGELTEQMSKELERQIASIVGIDETRGDTVAVAGIPFNLPAEDDVTMDTGGTWYSNVKPYDWFLYGTLGVTMVSAFVMIVGKGKKRSEGEQASEYANEIPESISNVISHEFTSMVNDSPRINQADIYLKELSEFFKNEPESATDLLQIWLSEESTSSKVAGMLLTGMEKSARLLIVLGREATTEVMKNLKKEDVVKLAHLIASVRSIPYEQTVALMEEFNQLVEAKRYMAQGGFDFAKDALVNALGMEQADELLSKVKGSPRKKNPFESIRHVDPIQIYNALVNERPQTIALVLCYLPSEKAASVMALLPEKVQTEVAQRIGRMSNTSSQTVDIVENVLETRLQSLMTGDMTQIGGVNTVVDILNAVDRKTQKHILELLHEENPELAGEVQDNLFTFEDLTTLDDGTIQRIIREVDMSVLALSLKGVSDQIFDCIMKNLSPRAGETLRENIGFLGAVRTTDVEKAQSEIISIIHRLEEAGEIMLGGGDDDVII